MFGKLVLILATVSQARHLRGPGEYNTTVSTSEPQVNATAAAATKSLVPYYMQQYKFPMCPVTKSKQVAIYKNATAFRREL